ncbi:GtrA family protein [Ruminococcaceae bacterium OttesenSCG-928-O06]|nr:GtrA family protein [Ruminococcaceae bacterium OttesenSCG-928-O06]
MNRFKKLFHFFWDRSLGVFLIIGGINTVLSNLTSYALVQWAGWGLFAATITAYAVFSVPSFYFNRRFSFQSKAPLGPSILRFTTLVTVCFFLSYGLNNLVVPRLRAAWFPGMNESLYTILRLVGIQAVFTILNYVGQRLWAFKPAVGTEEEAPKGA